MDQHVLRVYVKTRVRITGAVGYPDRPGVVWHAPATDWRCRVCGWLYSIAARVTALADRIDEPWRHQLERDLEEEDHRFARSLEEARRGKHL